VQPVTGFHVISVHSMGDFLAMCIVSVEVNDNVLLNVVGECSFFSRLALGNDSNPLLRFE
jgi:hypothetical protein